MERICERCGHPGSMHGDGVENTYTGECCHIISKENEEQVFCDCKSFTFQDNQEGKGK